MVTITKQRRHIFLVEKKTSIKCRFPSSKVCLGGLRPEQSQLHWPHGLRESLPEKRPGSIFLVARTQFLTQVFQESRCGRSESPEFLRLRVGRCTLCQSNKRT